ncbi:hypothetical protein [Phytohabitans aurantiacus]|jgi:hypothetical protein|uniref:Signal recognition particle-docking protein FtsY n=1 Tax=Phytohabitans aurantiacus TaxID=3016789 RepID=A0ABQ5R9M7_9ACTN|nr:hypothetical protein [Phytohabitans aurantiacus]GLI02675.1 hypothetical protein Pa4123_79530 [Phytohabitans aurantiacus]
MVDMLFIATAGALMLAAIGFLAAFQSRGETPRPGVPESPAPEEARTDV